MEKLRSAEIRWFNKGEPGNRILTWFEKQPGAGLEQEVRTDYYLLLPGEQDIGIKLREGLIEIKKQIAPSTTLRLPGISGHCEQWDKWSFGLEESGNFAAMGKDNQSRWIGISKKRNQKVFGVDDSHRPLPEFSGDVTARGIHLEFSEITIREEQWWSLAIEAYGDDDHNKTNLENLFWQIFHKKGHLALHTSHSYGYPEWISKVISKYDH